MNRGKPGWEELNGYVDGELAPAAAAEVAHAAARDEVVALRIAKLHAIKGALNDAYTQNQVIIAIPPQARYRHWPLSLAVGFVLTIAIFAAGLVLHKSADDRPSLVAEVLAKHEAWRQQAVITSENINTSMPLQLPDFTAAGFSAVLFDRFPSAEGISITQIGYVGRHGCRLSLFIAPAGAGHVQPELVSDDKILFAAWSTPSNTYFAVAKGLNRTRFAVITDALRDATTYTAPLDNSMRIALANAHQPCTT